MGTIYFICFDRAIGSDKSHGKARHYIGWTENLEQRLDDHRRGCGAKIMAYLHQQGIGWRVAFIIENVPKSAERKLKNWKKGPRLCPFCNTKKEIHFDGGRMVSRGRDRAIASSTNEGEKAFEEAFA